MIVTAFTSWATIYFISIKPVMNILLQASNSTGGFGVCKRGLVVVCELLSASSVAAGDLFRFATGSILVNFSDRPIPVPRTQLYLSVLTLHLNQEMIENMIWK